MLVALGRRYRDRISGFVGVAVARYEYLNGCVRYELERPMRGDERERVALVVDEQQITTLDAEPARATAMAGGPRSSRPVSR